MIWTCCVLFLPKWHALYFPRKSVCEVSVKAKSKFNVWPQANVWNDKWKKMEINWKIELQLQRDLVLWMPHMRTYALLSDAKIMNRHYDYYHFIRSHSANPSTAFPTSVWWFTFISLLPFTQIELIVFDILREKKLNEQFWHKKWKFRWLVVRGHFGEMRYALRRLSSSNIAPQK